MKKLIKILTLYHILAPLIRKSFLYKRYKMINGQIANMIYSNPSKGFFVIGVTGTDGKTTTSTLIHKILNDHVGKALLISTAAIKIGDQEIFNEKKMTSLDVYDLQATLTTARDNGCKIAVIEVSSHGLDQYRFEGVDFDMGVLTNITPEHLDYHGTFANYVAAKKKLFQYVLNNPKKNKMAVLPKDDETGRKRFDSLSFDKAINFGVNSSANLRAINIQLGENGTEFDIEYLGKIVHCSTQLVAQFNVYNILAAVGAATLIGLDLEVIMKSISELPPVSGRMNSQVHNNVRYIIDYAHTPNAVNSTLGYLSAIKKTGKVIHVFGAPGVRDKYKRPEMGRISSEIADITIVTDDDPDTENRLSIISDIVQGIPRAEGDRFFILPEREFAIQLATDIAQPGDTVILTGLGHQKVQLTNYGKRKWNDKEVLEKVLEV